MSEETDTINELISSITGRVNDTEKKGNDQKDLSSKEANGSKLFLIPKDSQLHKYIIKRLPIMMIYSGKLNDNSYDNADIDWDADNGMVDLMNDWGIVYDTEGDNVYVRTIAGMLGKMSKAGKTVHNGLVDSFRKHYGLVGNSNKNKQKALETVVGLLKRNDSPGEIAANKKAIANAWSKPLMTELNPMTRNLQLINPETDEIIIQKVKLKPSRGTGSKEQKEEHEQPKEEPERSEEPEEQPKEEQLVEVNKPSINPQILNDLVDNQNQQLATTDAIKTEILNTKNQLEEQKKILEKQNEILTAKDEFEKKLLSDKKIMRYIEAEDTFSFNELVNTIDELLSKPGKEADDFLIASAVQSVLNKRDALEKVRDNEKRKKSSQWSKAKIKDLRVEVQRDNNISPLLARTIASIS